MKLTKVLEDKENFVKKIIFEDNTIITETVLYNYQDRAVICFSTQSGCPVGCTFCGTGNRFIRSLTSNEMFQQISAAISILAENSKLPNKIQLMPMSMGEPMLNWINVKQVAMYYLTGSFQFFMSTVGINDRHILKDMYIIGEAFSNFGVQFSLHACTDKKRQKLFRNKTLDYMTIADMLQFAREFYLGTGNKVYFNYLATGKEIPDEIEWLVTAMQHCHLTCSVKCDIKKPNKVDPQTAIDLARAVYDMSDAAIDVSVFNPAGQDTIGGGCGQLLYVQEKFKQLKRFKP